VNFQWGAQNFYFAPEFPPNGGLASDFAFFTKVFGQEAVQETFSNSPKLGG